MVPKSDCKNKNINNNNNNRYIHFLRGIPRCLGHESAFTWLAVNQGYHVGSFFMFPEVCVDFLSSICLIR